MVKSIHCSMISLNQIFPSVSRHVFISLVSTPAQCITSVSTLLSSITGSLHPAPAQCINLSLKNESLFDVCHPLKFIAPDFNIVHYAVSFTVYQSSLFVSAIILYNRLLHSLFHSCLLYYIIPVSNAIQNPSLQYSPFRKSPTQSITIIIVCDICFQRNPCTCLQHSKLQPFQHRPQHLSPAQFIFFVSNIASTTELQTSSLNTTTTYS